MLGRLPPGSLRHTRLSFANLLALGLCCLFSVLSIGTAMGTTDELPFEIAEGFHVTTAAGDELVHDCFCMTTDGLGRPVVSGPGYIKTLIDDNQDGIYDRAIVWSTIPKQGAQGLWAEGRKILWVGDGGLWSSEDKNGDLVADGTPTKLIEFPTGGEHHVHAIRKGPDGYWYVIAGNFSNGISNLLNDQSSPVSRPRAGTLWRISPDFATKSVWSHGMRNCYDFDFLPDGQIVTFDSDCERESALPWYRPTRVFVLAPGSDAGWCGQTWKDQDEHITMPQTIASLGRGSPTGVAVYTHNTFPSKYHGAAFVLDWTFGRVIAVMPSRNLPESQRVPNRIPAVNFMQTTGVNGFAPTDLCVANNGDLLVCTGGRGTKGAIYRVAPLAMTDSPEITTNSETDSVSETDSMSRNPTENVATLFERALRTQRIDESSANLIAKTLNTPCPWDSWSESQWRKNLLPKHYDMLLQIVTDELPIDCDESSAASLKLLAAQILTRTGASVPTNAIIRAVSSPSPSSKLAGWWLVGRGVITNVQRDAIKIQGYASAAMIPETQTRWGDHLGSELPRLCLEAFGLKKWPMARLEPFQVESTPAGNSLRRTWLWALNRSPAPLISKQDTAKLDMFLAKRWFGPGLQNLDTRLLDFLATWFPKNHESLDERERLEFLAALQSALGDRKGTLPQQTDPANPDVLDGYKALGVRQLPDHVRKAWVDWLLYLIDQAHNSDAEHLEIEAIRTLAMFEPADSKVVEILLGLTGPKTHPTFDIHLLCAIACCTSTRSEETSAKIASLLIGVVRKLEQAGMHTDNQWPKRIQQLVSALMARDSKLASAFAVTPGQSCANDIVLINAFPVDTQAKVRERLQRELLQSEPSSWSNAIVRYALQSQPLSSDTLNALRKALEVPELRRVAIELLSNYPNAQDYKTYLETLSGSDRTIWGIAWRGLQSLPVTLADEEWPIMAKLVSETCNSSSTLPQDAVLVRARSAAKQLGIANPPASNNWNEWGPFLREHLADEVYEQLSQPKVKLDWAARMKQSERLQGNLEAGKILYDQKCASCHGTQTALGPSLAGVAKRFSRMDLGTAIFEPSRDVSDRYRAVRILTVDGEVYTGLVVYSAADGTTISTATGQIIRVNKDDLEELAYSTESIMPSGLLDDSNDQELANLMAYLSSL